MAAAVDSRNVGDVDLGLRRGGGHVDRDRHAARRTKVGLINLQAAQLAEVRSRRVVMKSKLPSSNLRPWNVTVWAIRFKASSEESICNWLAAIWSALKAPSFAASVTRPRMSFNSAAHLAQSTIGRGDNLVRPVRVADGLLDARDIAAKFSLAIKPAGSSLPVLIRKPVLSRVSACFQRSRWTGPTCFGQPMN